MKLDFMKFKLVYFLISLAFLIPSCFSLVMWGIKPAIDFTGGSLLELKFQPNDNQPVDLQITDFKLPENVVVNTIQKTGGNQFLLKMSNIDNNQKQNLMSGLQEKYQLAEEIKFETVGPTIGRELIKKTITAIILAAGFILLYIGYRFKSVKYGVCAVLAMFHDSLILLGSFSVLGHFFGIEVDTLFVTAVLTILSFSVHDTVVLYDRIRESVKLNQNLPYRQLVSKSVAETITRSLNNSLTIIFMLLSLFLFGGETIKWFVLALLIGTISGTYSSAFTAAPLLLVWDKVIDKKAR